MQYNEERKGVLMKKIIENVKFMQDGTMVFGDLYLEDGFVQRIDYKTPHMVSDIAIPGFVDIHTHGFHGYSCEEVDIKQLQDMALEYPKKGITSFCATISAKSLEDLEEIILAYRKAFQGTPKGAIFEGFHIEGPYLNRERKGSMDPKNIMDIQLSELETFLSKYHEDIKIMTIAPELKNGMEAIQLLHLYGVEVSLGHTDATYEQTKEALSCGATQITHLCNAMPKISHRHPTMLDAVFASECTCELIMDGVHVQREMLKWLIKLLGPQRIIAVTDGTPYSGFDYPDGYVLEDGSVVREGAIYGKEGQLLGSNCDLLEIFRYLYLDQQYDLSDCIRMCSTNAAKMLHKYSYEIGLGKKINLVVLDHDMKIKDVIINGRSSW